MGTILVEGIKLYAYHGCLEEEARIGSDYIVDITIEADLSKAELSDRLPDTVDYVKIYEIVKKEMALRSRLIEHAGKRIIDKIKSEFKTLEKVQVKVTKLNPPMNGNVEKVSIVVKE